MYALITGASSGIGREIAIQLAEKKTNLILVARRIDRLNELKELLSKKHGIDVVIKQYDLSILENCHSLHESVKSYEPEVVINNAGFGRVGAFDQIPLSDEINMLELNILALHALTKLFVGSMKKGVILNVASMAAFLPTPLLATYAASKAYVLSFSRAIDYEQKKEKTGIRVLTLCPGPVKTEFGEVAQASKLSLPGMAVEKCARIAIKGISKKKPKIIPGFSMKFLQFILHFIPTRLVLAISYKVQNRRN